VIPRQRRVGTALAVIGFAAVAAATLTPMSDLRGAALLTPLTCLVCGNQGGADVAGNLLLFLPFALGLRLAGWPWLRVVAASAAVSFTVELLQLTVVPGRDASLSDLLTNTTSGAMGAALGTVLPRLALPEPARAWRLLAAGLGVPLAVLGACAWLLVPEAPRGPLVSGWAHVARGMDVFGGRVQAVRLDGRPMPADGPPADPAALRQWLDRGDLTLDAEVVAGPPTQERLWMYTLRDESDAALALSQWHREAVFSIPVRGRRLRLRPPAVSLPDGLPADPGARVGLHAAVHDRRLTLTSTWGGATRAVTIGLSPAYGWTLVVPFELAGGTDVRWISGLCLVLLFAPAGYWAAWTGRPIAAAAALSAGIGAAIGALPAAAGYPPAHWSEWLAAALGAALGWALRRPAAYLQTRCVSPSASESSSS
jgi:hypothetical protein